MNTFTDTLTGTPDHRAGFVNIIGNPNVGKSTLMNQLVGEKISIMTSKAQTTRHRIKGIVNGDNYQIVYSDLPGVLEPAYMMQKMMMRFVVDSLQDADIILYMVDCGEMKYHAELVEKIKSLGRPIVLTINKIDKYTEEQIAETEQFWKQLFPDADVLTVSALKGVHIDELREKIIELLPLCPPYFPKDALTDRPMRFFVSELIREQILLQYKKEIPYSVEVVVDSYKEEEDIIRIGAILYVERDTQKAIIIGSKGAAIKKLGSDARLSIEDFLQKHVYLDLSVKVLKDWRNSELLMRRFGYDEGER
jgi:GTP-binding protein Era